MNFWNEMKKPILCLAPMADVTDAAFRYIISKYSKQITTHQKSQGEPLTYITYTEFVSADGLVKAPEEGRKKLLKDLEYSEIERPIVAQFFTNKPEMMEKAAELAVELGFDGIDINMGCPDKSIEKQGAGAALMKNPKLARELIVAAKQGVLRCHLRKNSQGGTLGIPISVKTRLGYNKDELETWLSELLIENPAAIIIHARTRKEMSKVPARWERIKRAVEIRDEMSRLNLDTKTLIIGNGDVKNVADAYKKCEETGADGAMIGRGIFGNPWLFANYKPTNEERIEVLIEHIKLFDEKFLGSPKPLAKAANFKSFAIMKKHFKEYLKNPDLRDLRFKLMRANTAKEAEDILMQFNTQ
ncbi:MAG: tRNA-dihydrouridine synthase family protein, partial [Patescibacteria group bacterium]